MKRLILIFVVVSLIFSSSHYTRAAEETNIIESANNWLFSKELIKDNYFKDKNDNGRNLNESDHLTGTRKTIVYGEPYGDPITINGGTRNRYLGYTMSDANFTNYMYPDDASGATSYYNRGYNKTNLVKTPWENPKTRTHYSVTNSNGLPADIKFCNNSEFEPYIKEGLRIRSRDEMARQGIKVDYPTVDFTAAQIESINWYEYIYIIQPPTDFSWGSGVLFRDNGAGYLTVPIPPDRYGATPTPTPIITPTPTFTPSLTSIPGVGESDTNPYSNAVIKADVRGTEKFDVLKGIPSSEDLYVNVISKQYLFNYAPPIEHKGTNIYKVTVERKYNLKWQEKDPVTGNWIDKSDSQTVSKTYNVKRDYSFWSISSLEIYGLEKAVLENKSLPSGNITLTPTNYVAPAVTADKYVDHIKEPTFDSLVTLDSKTINGGTSGKPSIPSSDWSNKAEDEVGAIKVRNDIIKINENTVMDDRWCDTDTPDPSSFPISSNIGNNVLYKNNLKIEPTLLNGTYKSSGTIFYKRIKNINGSTENINKALTVNSVTVHTPVVCIGDVWDDKDFNQELNTVSGKSAVILDRPSKIQITTSGQHKDILGYGNRDYGKYTKDKQVKFPFDVYINTTYKQEGKYLKANTWHSIPLDHDIIDFYVPSWVNEGNYSVDFREISVNAPDLTKTQDLANLDINNYIATRSIPVRVIGRLYGFRITDISDSVWKGFFRAGENTTAHSGNYFWVGTKDQDGNNRGNKFTLPLIEGSHPTLKNVGAIKTGYNFKFELVTIGNYFNDHDSVFIEPRFYFIDKQGKNRQEVDLYYNERFNDKENYFIKIDDNSQNHANKKNIQLGNVYRNVTDSEIKDTSRILGVQENVFRKQDTFIGWFDWIALTKGLRTFIGDITNLPAGVDADRVRKSKQKWYGEYYLPNYLFVCPKDTKVAEYGRTHNGLNGKENFWLKDGYIIVNFDIKTSKDTSFNPVLSYCNSFCNMWKTEGYNYTKTDYNGITFNLNNGDTVFYYANKRASDDYQEGGTH